MKYVTRLFENRPAALALCLLVFTGTLCAQTEGVSISSAPIPPHGSAILDVQSTVKGMAAPTMTFAQMNAIPAPKKHGLYVFVDDDTDNTKDGFYYWNTNANAWRNFGGDGLWTQNGYDVFRMTGNVGIGTNTPTQRIDLRGDFSKMRAGTDTKYMVVGNDGANSIIETTGGPLLINYYDKNPVSVPGDLTIGLLANSLKITSNGTNNIINSNGANLTFQCASNKAVIMPNNVQFPSDFRLKDNIQPLYNALAHVLQLRGVSYHLKKDSTDQLHIGVVAQEVEAVYPQLVRTISLPEEDREMKSVNYIELIPVLLEAIKEQQAQIEILKAQIKALEH
ncbi:MAG: tail fiber domain-containing protein [Saprospiraceae bacterium]